MTTSETDITLNSEETVRPLDELFALGTYQGMSDAEIDSIIAYKVEVGQKETIVTGALNAQIVEANANVEITRQAMAEANSIAKQILSKSLDLGKIVSSYDTEVE